MTTNQKGNQNMKTSRKNYGPFTVVSRTIRATLRRGEATLRCDVQKGTTPMGRKYRTQTSWWIQFDHSPCAMGPWDADGIRKYFAA